MNAVPFSFHISRDIVVVVGFVPLATEALGIIALVVAAAVLL